MSLPASTTHRPLVLAIAAASLGRPASCSRVSPGWAADCRTKPVDRDAPAGDLGRLQPVSVTEDILLAEDDRLLRELLQEQVRQIVAKNSVALKDMVQQILDSLPQPDAAPGAGA